MAKYEVKYACGHGSHTEQLFGKNILREEKIVWMERNMVCPTCYRKEHQDDAPIVYLDMSIFGWNPGALKINFVGNTFQIKEKLKARGYRFCDNIQRKGDWLGAKSSLKGWYKILATSDELKKGNFNIEAILEEINWATNEFWIKPEMPSEVEIIIAQAIRNSDE